MKKMNILFEGSERQNIVLIGAGGHAKVAAEIASMIGFDITSYVDDNKALWLDSPQWTDEVAQQHFRTIKGTQYFIGLGGQTVSSLQKRYQLFLKYADGNTSISPILIHPRAVVSESSRVGMGSLICAGAIVQPMAEIGNCVILNTGSIIEHDCRIGDGTHIAPGAIILGNVTIGKHCMIGSGAILLPGVNIPNDTLIKANSLTKAAATLTAPTEITTSTTRTI